MNRRTRHRIIRLLFIPVAILIWMIGWTLLYIDSRRKPQERDAQVRTTAKDDSTVIITVIPEQVEA
jgi:hypothetical protein